MNAYVGFRVVLVDDMEKAGVVDHYDTEKALVWWGWQKGHKTREQNQQWVPWAQLRFLNGETAEFSEQVKRRERGGRL